MGFGVTTTQIPQLLISIPTFEFDAGTQKSGATTLAVAVKKVLLFGRYGDRHIECHLITLEDGDARLDAEVSLVLPREIDVARDSIIGRDKQLHVFLDDHWFVFSLDSLC
jgi:hypothetical protein